MWKRFGTTKKENIATLEEVGNKRAVDAYRSGQDNFEGLTLATLSDKAIEAAPVSATLMRRLKFRGGTQLTATDEDFVRLNNMVRSTRLFHGLEVGKIDAIMRQIQLWRFEEGERIIKQNESGLGLFFIDRGQLNIEINRRCFARASHQQIGPTDLFGEPLFYRDSQPKDVVSATGSRLRDEQKALHAYFDRKFRFSRSCIHSRKIADSREYQRGLKARRLTHGTSHEDTRKISQDLPNFQQWAFSIHLRGGDRLHPSPKSGLLLMIPCAWHGLNVRRGSHE